MKHSNLSLVEGEVYVLAKPSESLPKQITYIEGRGYLTVLASTADLDGIPKIERKWFVKPLDIESLQQAYIHERNLYHYDDREQDIIKSALEDGYNSNKSEFTRDEMIEGMALAFIHGQQNVCSKEFVINSYLDMVRPLSLPKSITFNDDNEIISVEW